MFTQQSSLSTAPPLPTSCTGRKFLHAVHSMCAGGQHTYACTSCEVVKFNQWSLS